MISGRGPMRKNRVGQGRLGFLRNTLFQQDGAQPDLCVGKCVMACLRGVCLNDGHGFPYDLVILCRRRLAPVCPRLRRAWRAAAVYHSSTEMTALNEHDTLEGEGVLTGFSLPLADLFAV